MNGSSWLRRGMVACAAFAVAITTACTAPSSSGSSDYDDDDVAVEAPDAGNTGDTACFLPLDNAQQQEMQEYAAQPGSAEQANGVQSVCVLEQDTDGTYVEHYYQEQDNFPLFLAFALLSKHSKPIMAYGLLAGQITPMEYVLLSTLVCIGSDGKAYHPYTKQKDSSWTRQAKPLGYKVAKVRYGSRPAVAWAPKQKPVAGYGRTTLKPVTQPRREVGAPATQAKPPATTTSAPSSSTQVPPTTTSSPKVSPPPPRVTTTRPKCKPPKPYGVPPNCRKKP